MSKTSEKNTTASSEPKPATKSGSRRRESPGNQIEYHDEDPAVRRMFEDELAKQGLKSEMEKFYR